jgi:hypothetical protein
VELVFLGRESLATTRISAADAKSRLDVLREADFAHNFNAFY